MSKGLLPPEEKMLETILRYIKLKLPENYTFFHGEGDAIRIHTSNDGYEVHISDTGIFPRAISLLAQLHQSGQAQHTENAVYKDLGVMVDCSRNAVPRPEILKKLMVMLRCMGYTSMQLYMEDVYELPGRPYFGYLRGRYTADELKDLDAFACGIGLELFPAIQTLAHLERLLRWPAMQPLRDIEGVLLVDSEETYRLIEEMLSAMSSCFTSRRINLGMDEAVMLGLGKHLEKHGAVNRTQLMLQHCDRVMQLTAKYGLQPMIWSDMFFRLANQGEYYADGETFDASVSGQIPGGLDLVYWDYYSTGKARYDRMFKAHQRLKPGVIFAAGAWKWSGYSPSNYFSIEAAKAAHASCTGNEVEQVFITAWGDNGAECSLFSVLPTLQYWAELCYVSPDPDRQWLAQRFQSCCNAGWDSFLCLDEATFTPENPKPGEQSVNPPKYILYQDVLHGIFDRHIQPDAYQSHFEAVADKLKEARKNAGSDWVHLFDTQIALCEILAVKCRTGIDMRHAYRHKNKVVLQKYKNEILPALIEMVNQFIALYHTQWQYENKNAGLDVFDIKLGGMLQRLKTATTRLEEYLAGKTQKIEELEEDILYYDGRESDTDAPLDICAHFWHEICTPSTIAGV